MGGVQINPSGWYETNGGVRSLSVVSILLTHIKSDGQA